MKAKDINGVCSACKGKGDRAEYFHVENGVCFGCGGFGSVAKFQAYNEIISLKRSAFEIEAAKEEIVQSYLRVKKWEALGKNNDFLPIKNARRFATDAMNKLNGFGITFTLKEIEEMAKEKQKGN